ncbi:MAG: TRAP transporter small permease subunit [Pseudomonadota bacterium]
MVRRLERIAALWALLGGVGLIAIVAVTTTNVALFAADRVAALSGRAVSGIVGYEDFVALVTSCAALAFFPYCQVHTGHVRVDLFASAMPAALRRGLDRVWLVLTAVAALFLAGMMLQGLLESRDDGALSRILGWPVWPFYVPGILSLLLWAAIAAAQAAGRDQGRAQGREQSRTQAQGSGDG